LLDEDVSGDIEDEVDGRTEGEGSAPAERRNTDLDDEEVTLAKRLPSLVNSLTYFLTFTVTSCLTEFFFQKSSGSGAPVKSKSPSNAENDGDGDYNYYSLSKGASEEEIMDDLDFDAKVLPEKDENMDVSTMKDNGVLLLFIKLNQTDNVISIVHCQEWRFPDVQSGLHFF
jgi:hypothetical protein